MNILEKPVRFLKETKVELSKVSWSTREELIGSTIVVISMTFIAGLFIFIIDFLLSKVLSVLFK
ncbi:MAG: preprotein translocase subunit SecE [Candidatus Omnitrophica bacterium]|nr:preprotein translocase subunit SecE [Candidatus Omnitrophota bacterium]